MKSKNALIYVSGIEILKFMRDQSTIKMTTLPSCQQLCADNLTSILLICGGQSLRADELSQHWIEKDGALRGGDFTLGSEHLSDWKMKLQ